jgi:exosortase
LTTLDSISAGKSATSSGREGDGEAQHSLAVVLGFVTFLLALLIWSYWPTLFRLIRDWQTDDNYSVGQLVPFAAVYMLWQDRGALRKRVLSPSWWGLGLIFGAQAMRYYGVSRLIESVERYSIVLTLIGLVLLLAGWRVLWQTRWVLLFMFLMIPLPGRIHNEISGPLQNQATAGAVFFLELAGMTVDQQGTMIVLNDHTPMNIAEACSGLRMLTAFVVVSAVMAYLVGKPKWQKAILLLSSVPIAIVCNIIRLCATAVLFLVASSEVAEEFFHDFAGLVMMPLAVFILIGELILMNAIVPPGAPAAKSG